VDFSRASSGVGRGIAWDKWADHATVEATFKMHGKQQVSQVWRQPQPFPWPTNWDCQLDFDITADSTMAYAQFWQQLETQAQCWNAQQGKYISRAQCGRAQTLATQTRKWQGSPPKLGREGEVQPKYFGISLQHARYFRQLRRLQALTQLLKKGLASDNAITNAQETWRAIRGAAGFPGGFVHWWAQHGLGFTLASPLQLPYFLPALEVVESLFEGFHSFVKAYEGRLAQRRYQYGTERRREDMNLVFQDCKAEPPPVVDTLLDRVEVAVEEVRPEDSSVVLVRPVELLHGLPVVIHGHAHEVLVHEHDQVWLSSVEGLAPGHVLTQERVVMTDAAVLDRFRQTWEPRWNKPSHVAPGQ